MGKSIPLLSRARLAVVPGRSGSFPGIALASMLPVRSPDPYAPEIELARSLVCTTQLKRIAQGDRTAEWKADLEKNYWTDEFVTGAQLKKEIDKDYVATRAVLVDLALAK